MASFNYTRARMQLRQAIDKVDEIENREKQLTGENTYKDAQSESFGRIPETCDIVEEIVNRHISFLLHKLRSKQKSTIESTDGDFEIKIKESPESNALIRELKNKVTLPFRKALTESLEQKYSALGSLIEIRESASVAIVNTRTPRPERKEKIIAEPSDDEDEPDL